MIQIENLHVSISVNPMGAELQSIYCKDNQLEYLWSGDPAFWAKKSPVLFPIGNANLLCETFVCKRQFLSVFSQKSCL